MSNLSTLAEKTIREELLPTIQSTMPMVDRVYRSTVRSSQNVTKNTGLGRGHKVIVTYDTGVSGGASFGSVEDGQVISGPSNFNVYSNPETFPGLDETTAPAFFTSEVSLIRHKGNFYVPAQILRTDQYNASIGSVLAKILKGVSLLQSQQEASLFYSLDSKKTLADMGDTSVTVTNGATTSSIVVNLGGTNAAGRVHRFLEGMLVDIYDTTGVTHRNPDFLVAVDAVDPIAQTIELKRLDGGTLQTTTTLNGGITYAGAGGDDDVIVIKDSISQGPITMNTWIANSGTLFTIDLAAHPRFKSLIKTSVGSALSESLLNKWYYEFYRAYPDKNIGTAITTMGVLLGLIDNLDGYNAGNANAGRFRFDRNGEPVDVDLGFEGVTYRFAGRPVTIHTSNYCEEGHWYGLNLNGNLVRYVPPDLPGARSDSRVSGELEFVAPATGGSNSIFAHVTVGDRLTNFSQAPFVREYQVMPKDPVSLKATGITPISI